MADDELQMEHGFLKAPWEMLMRSFRVNHKGVIKDAEALAEATSALVDEARAASQDAPTIRVPPERVNALIARVATLQARLDAARTADRWGMDICLARIGHLQRRTQPSFNASARAAPPVERANAPESAPDPTPVHTAISVIPNGKVAGAGARSGADSSAPDNVARSARRRSIAGDDADAQKPSHESVLRWEKTRLDRVLVDYMLRAGLYASGDKLARSERIEPLVDTTLFHEARRVIQALRDRDCTAALKWCADNKRRLAKTSSSLEFDLHRQQFVELARSGDKKRAIKYVQHWNSAFPLSDEQRDKITCYMGLLCFSKDTPCEPYKRLFAQERWAELEESFKQENYKLHGLTGESTLEILLKTGLASLKTRKCGTESDRKGNCPTCNEPYLSLSKNLPHSQHINSILVCAISADIMDENNPPMALPNGNVYSYNALKDIAARNDNYVIDPKTSESFLFMTLRKCYIM